MGLSLSEAVVVDILTSPEIDAHVAKRYGITRQAVNMIRRGQTYPNVRPDIERRPGRILYCHNCIQWDQGRCLLGFPEAQESIKAATECHAYHKKS